MIFQRSRVYARATLAVVLGASFSVSAQQMQRAEEPDEVGLTKIWPDLTAQTSDSLPFTDRNFLPTNALIVAEGLRGSTPYAYTVSVRSTAPVQGRASCDTDSVYYGKHIPLQTPATGGEWRRVSFFFRTAPGTTGAMIRFSSAPKGEETEFKDPHLSEASEEEFAVAWNAWRAGYPERELSPRSSDGQNLRRFIDQLQNPLPGENELLVYGIGSSYTNMLGNGERLIQWVREHFPNAPKIVYKKHVGSAVAYDFTRGWMRQLVLGERPDLVILYSEGEGEDLETLLQDFRKHSAADVIVASLHLRERAGANTPETVHNAQWKGVREVAEKYGCEWVDNRVEHAAYLTEHGKPIEWLLKDAVHQSDHGALVINENIVRHLAPQAPTEIRRLVDSPATTGGYRVDLYGERSPDGQLSRVTFDGAPADAFPAFVTTVIVPGEKNHKPARGSAADRSPHLIELGDLKTVIPQQWTIEMTSDTGDFKLIGSITGEDGGGNNAQDVTSDSGQITVPTALWRRRVDANGVHSNKKGDVFTWEVRRSTVGEVDFSGPAGEPFRVTLGTQLPHLPIAIEVENPASGAGKILGYEQFHPAR